MWPFNRIYSRSYLAENNGLRLSTMIDQSGPYGNNTHISQCTVKKWAKKSITKHYTGSEEKDRPALLVKASWKGKYFPVVDADSDIDFMKAGLWLDEQGFTYSVIKSANNHWYIVDKEYTLEKALVVSKMIPGNDKKYCKHSSLLMLRMSLKLNSDRLPKVVTIGNETAEFVNAIQKFLDENENLIRYVDRFMKFHHDDKKILEDAGENKYGISLESILGY